MGTSRWDSVNGSSWGFGLGKKFTAVCVPYSPALWLSIASIIPTAKPGCVDWVLGAGGFAVAGYRYLLVLIPFIPRAGDE